MPRVDTAASPGADLKFWDRWGTYAAVPLLAEQAMKARDLIGRRVIQRVDRGVYLVQDDSARGKYRVTLFETDCTCPQKTMAKVRVCKHLIACQWVEDMLQEI